MLAVTVGGGCSLSGLCQSSHTTHWDEGTSRQTHLLGGGVLPARWGRVGSGGATKIVQDMDMLNSFSSA